MKRELWKLKQNKKVKLHYYYKYLILTFTNGAHFSTYKPRSYPPRATKYGKHVNIIETSQTGKYQESIRERPRQTRNMG